MRSLFFAVMVAVLGTAIAAQSTPPRPPASPAPPRAGTGPDPREETARRVCGVCHPFEYVIAVKRTRAQWEATVENMVGRGARGTNAELTAVIDYLAESHVLTPSNVRGGAGPADKPMVDPKASEAARPLYTKNCLTCHGADARGTPQGLNLVRSIVVLHDRYGSTLGPFLRASHPPVPGPGGSTMPQPFEGLTSQEVLLLSHFLRDRVNDTLRGAPMFKPGNVLVGDAKAGAEYFQGEGGCTQCHSPTADLAGIGRRLEPINLQQRFLFPHTARRTGPGAKVVTVTVTTESGETHSGVLRSDLSDAVVLVSGAGAEIRILRREIMDMQPGAVSVMPPGLAEQLSRQELADLLAFLKATRSGAN